MEKNMIQMPILTQLQRMLEKQKLENPGFFRTPPKQASKNQKKQKRARRIQRAA